MEIGTPNRLTLSTIPKLDRQTRIGESVSVFAILKRDRPDEFHTQSLVTLAGKLRSHLPLAGDFMTRNYSFNGQQSQSLIPPDSPSPLWINQLLTQYLKAAQIPKTVPPAAA